jgi:hypothetical protein
MSLPHQAVRGGSLSFRQVHLTFSPCLYLLSLYVGIPMLPSSRPDRFALSLRPQDVRRGSLCFHRVGLTILPCLYLLRLYVGVFYASVKST